MISPTEKQKRLDAIADVVGTHRAEGIVVEAEVHRLMKQFADGTLTLEQFSAAVDQYAADALGEPRLLAGAA